MVVLWVIQQTCPGKEGSDTTKKPIRSYLHYPSHPLSRSNHPIASIQNSIKSSRSTCTNRHIFRLKRERKIKLIILKGILPAVIQTKFHYLLCNAHAMAMIISYLWRIQSFVLCKLATTKIPLGLPLAGGVAHVIISGCHSTCWMMILITVSISLNHEIARAVPLPTIWNEAIGFLQMRCKSHFSGFFSQNYFVFKAKCSSWDGIRDIYCIRQLNCIRNSMHCVLERILIRIVTDDEDHHDHNFIHLINPHSTHPVHHTNHLCHIHTITILLICKCCAHGILNDLFNSPYFMWRHNIWGLFTRIIQLFRWFATPSQASIPFFTLFDSVRFAFFLFIPNREQNRKTVLISAGGVDVDLYCELWSAWNGCCLLSVTWRMDAHRRKDWLFHSGRLHLGSRIGLGAIFFLSSSSPI